MITTFKEVFLPVIVYLLLFGGCLYTVTRRPQFSLWVYCVLVMFPQLWHPIHNYPLGTLTLTLLVLAMLAGSVTVANMQPSTAPAPSLKLLLVVVAYTYICLWNVSLRYDLGAPISTDNAVFKDWKNYAMMLMLYLAAFRVLRDENDLKTVAVIMVVVLLLTSWREYRNFYGSISFSYGRRAQGTFDMLGMNANHFGAFVSNVGAFTLGLMAVDKHKTRRWLYLATFLSSLYPLFFSYSRGAYAAILVAAGFVGVVRYRFVLWLLVALAFTWQTVLPDTVVERLTMTENADGEVEESAAMRLVVWNLAQKLFGEYPLFGIGFNGFFYATEGLPLRNAHNYYLTVAAEQGVVGVLLLALVLLRALASGWKLFRTGNSDLIRGVGLGFVAYALSMATTNVFGDRYSQLAMGSYFWILFGAVERGLMLSKAAPAEAPSRAKVQPLPQ